MTVSLCPVARSRDVRIFSRRLKSARDAAFLSQAELGAAAEMGLSNIQRLERGETSAVMRTRVPKLAAALRMTEAEFMERIAMPNGHELPAAIDPTHEPVPEVPTIEFDTSAGPWIQTSICEELNYDDPVQRWIIETGRFRMRIRGDSMAPMFKSGMTIEFKILRADEVPTLKRAYAVCRDDGCATFKSLKEITDDEWVLTAINRRKYPDEIRVARQRIVRVAEAVDVIERIEW